jgi:hypothetical protein
MRRLLVFGTLLTSVCAKQTEVYTFTTADEVETNVFNGDDAWLVLFSKGACATCDDVTKVLTDVVLPIGSLKVANAPDGPTVFDSIGGSEPWEPFGPSLQRT